MNRLLLTLLLLTGFAFHALSQTYSIRGTVKDTVNLIALHRASVTVVRTSDSVVESFTRTDPDGRFEVRVRSMGKYFMRVTFPSFADYIDVVNVKQSMTDLGELPMVSKEHLLKEFVLTQQIAAIKIKGDTTEYMADSFKVKENATVEDLLKKLPGIQVDKDGKITAQGETVQKVLVDGEEFFSDDPKVVTKGLQANAVSKVQVYDKKSDQAEFTGIEDGEKTKTINLELKEDKKKGYFGKLAAGGGNEGYFQNEAMLNSFKAKRQFSAFGIASNTNKAGLGWQDNDKFGNGGGVTQLSDDGDIMTTYFEDNEDFAGWDGKYKGEGLPKTWTGGAHYADKWNEAKNHASANYRYAQQNVEIDGNTLTQYSLPGDTIRIMNAGKNQFGKTERNSMDAMMEIKIDSNSSIKIQAEAGLKNAQTSSVYHTTTSTVAGAAHGNAGVNDRTVTSDANAQFINADLLYRKKFARKGRTLSVDVKENYKDSKSTGLFKSAVYDSVSPANKFLTNQKKINDAGSLAFSTKATYTEPISKVAFVEADYGVTVNNSSALNESFDTSSAGIYSDAPNSTFSSNYTYNVLSNAVGLNFKFIFKTFNFSFGSDVSKAVYVQTDHFNGDTSITRSYTNLFPKAAFKYKLGKQASLNFFYHGNTKQPAITQVQPYRQNTDPLNLVEGNPALKQEFNNNFSLRFNDFKMMSSRYLWSNMSLNMVSDAISTEQTITGPVSRTKYINVDGNYTGFAYVGYGRELPKLDLEIGAQVSYSQARINNVINGQRNTSDNSGFSLTPYFNYEKDDVFEISWSPELIYNNNKSTNNETSIGYFIFNNQISTSLPLPKKFEIGSSVNIMIREKTQFFTANNNVVKWSAYIDKKFLKKDQLVLELSVFDILNQNIGFSREGQGSMVTQNSYNTIRRYFMLQLTWNFTHTPAGAPPANGAQMIIE